jgi:hypothetical protein
VNHPPARRTPWPRSGSASRLAPSVLPRWVSSSCEPVCHHYARRKTPGQAVFLSSQGYPPTNRSIPRTNLFIHC